MTVPGVLIVVLHTLLVGFWPPAIFHIEIDAPLLTQPSADPPIVIVESRDPIDRGKVPLGSVARRVFTIKNNSDSTLSLAVSGKSCACLITKLDTQTLAPGVSTSLDVSVVVTGGYGVQSHSLRLEASSQTRTGKPARQAIDLGISFTPDRTYEVVPRLLIIRSIIGETRSGTISVVTPPGSDLVVRDIDSGTDAIAVHECKPSPKNPAVRTIEFTATPTQPGSRQSILSFATNSESLPTGTVDVTVVGLTPWRADPPGLVATYTPPIAPAVLRCTLTPRGTTAPTPTTVTLHPEVAGVKVWLETGQVLMSDLTRSPLTELRRPVDSRTALG